MAGLFLILLIYSFERRFPEKQPQNLLICSRKRKVQKPAQDINLNGSFHVECVVLMCASSEAGKC